jgi:hypothetical protein
MWKSDENKPAAEKRRANSLIGTEYETEAWRKTYDCSIPPVVLHDLPYQWDIGAPPAVPVPGRKRKNRASDGVEERTGAKIAPPQKCGRCKQPGHNARNKNCPKYNAVLVEDGEGAEGANNQAAMAQEIAAGNRAPVRTHRGRRPRATRVEEPTEDEEELAEDEEEDDRNSGDAPYCGEDGEDDATVTQEMESNE